MPLEAPVISTERREEGVVDVRDAHARGTMIPARIVKRV